MSTMGVVRNIVLVIQMSFQLITDGHILSIAEYWHIVT